MLKVIQSSVPRLLFVLATLDFLLLLSSFYIGLAISWVAFTGAPSEIWAYFPRALLYSGSILLVCFSLGLYQGQVIVDRGMMVQRLIVSFALALLFLAGLFYSLPILEIWRAVLAGATPVAFFALLVVRLFLLRGAALTPFKEKIVVLGAGERAASIEALAKSPWSTGFTCQGFLPTGEVVSQVPSERCLPRVNSLADFCKDSGVSKVVVAAELPPDKLPNRQLLDCRLRGIEVSDYATFFAHQTGRIDLDHVEVDWFLYSDGYWGIRSYKFVKRGLDMLLSALLLLLALPLCLVVAVAIRLQDRGPIFYSQDRVGLGGKPFRMFKFRSMCVQAEGDGRPRWAEEGDPRITLLGTFLRRTRIDEIPQFLNVLKGDMSLVGPRPERPYFVESLTAAVPFYADRHAVKPGLTGWAQLHYRYGASGEEARRKLEYDLYYVKFFGLFLDLAIILQTARVIIWPNGVR